MKALFINAEKREIREVDYSPHASAGGFPTINSFLNGGWIEAAWRWPNGDTLYVDEEGLLKPTMHFFFCRFRPDQPMAGNGVLVGEEIDDENVPGGYYTADPAMTVDQLKPQILWLDRDMFDRWARANADRPASTVTTYHQGVPITETLQTYGQLHAGMGRKDDK